MQRVVVVTVVWEARAVQGQGPFDFWFYESKVLIEVDGEQHVEGSYQSTSAEEQMGRDREKDTAAVSAGFHVVRLHYRDVVWWSAVLFGALHQALAGVPPSVHFTPSYPPTLRL